MIIPGAKRKLLNLIQYYLLFSLASLSSYFIRHGKRNRFGTATTRTQQNVGLIDGP